MNFYERIAAAAESIAADVKRFVDAADASERQAREAYGEAESDALAEARALLRDAVPLVREIFWDRHSAGTICGSGLSHRAYSMSAAKWDWCDVDGFKRWESRAFAILNSEVKR